MAAFGDATQVRTAGDGQFEADLDPLWTVGGKPNGGYLLAILARAAVVANATHPHPLSASAVYLSPPDPGPAGVSVEVLRTGRSASQVRARLSQKDRNCVEALLTVYVLALPAPGPVRVRQRARLLSESLVDQVCEIWDSTDRVVAQATQLAAYRLAAPA